LIFTPLQDWQRGEEGGERSMAGCVATVEERVQKAALPLHVQKLQRALRVDCLLTQVETVFGESLTDKDELE